MPQHAYPAIANGWHLVCPLGSLYESYDFINGEPFSYDNSLYDPTDLGKNRDPRLSYTLLYDNVSFGGKKYICHPDSSRSLDQLGAGKQTTYTGFGLRKYFDEGYSGSLYQYGANTVVVRYAEVLLSYLEAVLESGEAIDQQLLDATINKVRGRTSVNMPPINETNPDKLRPLLRNERRDRIGFGRTPIWIYYVGKLLTKFLMPTFMVHHSRSKKYEEEKQSSRSERSLVRYYPKFQKRSGLSLA